jgi:hypothetical protein
MSLLAVPPKLKAHVLSTVFEMLRVVRPLRRFNGGNLTTYVRS